MFYTVRTRFWMRWLYPAAIWYIPSTEKVVYLSFDDGPHPEITGFVLDQLKKYEAKATFFCLGKNVKLYPEVYQRIKNEEHAIGNHGQHHLNGWKTPDAVYLNDVYEATGIIKSNLFRPPYGKIKRSQLATISKAPYNLKTIMWSVLSGDFDISKTGKECANNVLKEVHPGAIIVFHDSEKAYERLRYALPEILEKLKEDGYRFEILN